MAVIFASLETYKLSCYGQDVMFPAQNEHGFPRMHCEKGLNNVNTLLLQ